jgi:hypothetical protein
MREKLLTLLTFMTEENKIVVKLRRANYSSSCYSLLMMAKFVNDSDVVVITDEKVFTFQNTSKEQMSRVSLQCYLTLSLSARLMERAKAEVILASVKSESNTGIGEHIRATTSLYQRHFGEKKSVQNRELHGHDR